MNATTEIEALTITRERSANIERAARNYELEEDEGVRSRFDAFIAGLGRIIEKQGPMQPSDLL